MGTRTTGSRNDTDVSPLEKETTEFVHDADYDVRVRLIPQHGRRDERE
jgi:hypothetical protein